MVLRVEEINVGCVSYLDGDGLLADQRVANGDHGKIGQRRPFVCIRVSGEACDWMLLTSQQNPRRIDLDNWKVPGSSHWMKTKQYLHDARKIFSGPKLAFTDASAQEINPSPHPRPSISSGGITKIIAEVLKYHPEWQ